MGSRAFYFYRLRVGRPSILVLCSSHLALLCRDHRGSSHCVATSDDNTLTKLKDVCFFKLKSLKRSSDTAFVDSNFSVFNFVWIRHQFQNAVVFGCFNFTLKSPSIKNRRRRHDVINISARVVAIEEA